MLQRQYFAVTFGGLRDEQAVNTVVDSAVSHQVTVRQLRQQRHCDACFQHLIRVTTQFRHQIGQPAGQSRAITRAVVRCLPQLVQLTH